MTVPAPRVDRRTTSEVMQQVQDLLKVYAPAWQEFDPETGNATGVSGALIGIFGRFAELIIQRLNQAPQKNFLAFLDLLGATLLPPQPARVPLTFSLAAGSAVDGLVLAGTQVAAPPAEEEKDPVIFETERELTVTAAQLTSLFVRDPALDRYADVSSVSIASATTGVLIFQGDQQIEHIFYIGQRELLGFAAIDRLSLQFTLLTLPSPSDPRELRWEVWDGNRWQENILNVREDETRGLRQSGTIVFGPLPAVPESPVHAVDSRWLRCRLLTPITQEIAERVGMVRVSHLPRIDTIEMAVTAAQTRLMGDTAFTNQLPVDVSKDFFPFGEKPKFADTFWFAQREALMIAGARILLSIELRNPADSRPTSPPPTKVDGRPVLKWEVWTGTTWVEMGTSTTSDAQGPTGTEFKDTTKALTVSGQVSFRLPEHVARSTVNGVENCWVRVRIVAGDYGQDARYVPREPNNPAAGYNFFPATFAPPVISAITVDYTLNKAAAPEVLLTFNDHSYQDVTAANSDPNQTVVPFRPTLDVDPTFYVGFILPTGRPTFPNRTLSLYVGLKDVVYGGTPVSTVTLAQPHLVWEYWNGQTWSSVTVRDETANFTRSGLLEFLAPPDITHTEEFSQDRYWLRVRWEEGDYPFAPRLQHLLLNTTMAAQTVTIQHEVLGSSDGTAGQTFRATRTPILLQQQFAVREPEFPTIAEVEVITQEEGVDAITRSVAPAGNPKEVWVRWHEVSDFYGSGPRSRHYVLDHLTGEIRTGDGLHGLIPPIGVGNLRLTRYQVGGGSRGNKPPGTIVQLKTTVPYVDKVINTEAATGGAETETVSSLLERAPRTIRHGNRAVTVEDYEDLAMLASPAVARARSVPLRNLLLDPLGAQEVRGEVSVIIVPRSSDAKPQPSLELLSRVQQYLEAHSVSTARVAVVGALYIRVDVKVTIAVVSLESVSVVERVVGEKLASFLHPLTGGLEGRGWDFGRKPHRSDVYALLEAIPGVDHLRSLEITETEDQPGIGATGRFLVFSGSHTVSLVFAAT